MFSRGVTLGADWMRQFMNLKDQNMLLLTHHMSKGNWFELIVEMNNDPKSKLHY